MKEVIVFKNQFPMVFGDTASVVEAWRNNMANAEMTKRDLFAQIPNPKGGEDEWTIDGPLGKRSFEMLEGVILHIGNERAYYEEEYGVGETKPPMCSSPDGVAGEGNPGGRCAVCAMAEFGPPPENKRPQCDQKKPMYLLVPEVNPVMPVVINVTGPSFPAVKAFSRDLTQYGIKIFAVKVRMTLKKDKTKTGKPCSIIQFKVVDNIETSDPSAFAALAAYRQSLLEFIDPNFQKMQAMLNGTDKAA